MQDINPDMEELLQRAAADYPLKNGDDRWNEIAGRISPNPFEAKKDNVGTGLVKYASFLLLTLFSFIFLNDTQIIIRYAQPNTDKETTTTTNSGSATKKALQQKISTSHHKAVVSSTSMLITQVGRSIHTDPNETLFKTPDKLKILRSKDQIKLDNVLNSNNTPRATSELKDNGNTQLKEDKRPFQISGETLQEKQAEDKTLLLLSSEKAELHSQKNNTAKGFYYGIEAGIGLNAIRNQAFSHTGFSVGFIGGYRVNSSLTIESGLIYARKNYHTTGKYFNMDEIHKTNPSVTEVLDVRGYSNFLEIPIRLRYDMFRKNNKQRIYSTVGLSTYVMTLEKNNYQVVMNGGTYPMKGTYKKDKVYFAASIDVGVGFEKNINSKTQLRITPHLQLPINGVGMGSLPVKTLDVRIGITRSLH
ncbi:hypothetical protein BH10BAC3_BH10BAC3_23560 [soil metagenome]